MNSWSRGFEADLNTGGNTDRYEGSTTGRSTETLHLFGRRKLVKIANRADHSEKHDSEMEMYDSLAEIFKMGLEN